MEWKELQRKKFELFLLMQDLQEELRETEDEEEKKLILEEMEKVEREILKLMEKIRGLSKRK